MDSLKEEKGDEEKNIFPLPLREEKKGNGKKAGRRMLKETSIGGETMKETLKKAGVTQKSLLMELSETFEPGVPFYEARIDKGENIIKHICLLTPISKNGRVYQSQAIEEAVGLFEGAKAFANHPRRSERGEVRDVRDLIGKCVNVNYSGGKLKADLLILESHKEWVFPLAEQAPELVGLSINAQGKVRRIEGKDVVEEIVEVRSVDLVSEPAATKGLFEELSRKEEEGFFKELSLEKIRQHRKDLIEAIHQEKEPLTRQLQEEVNSLREELNSYKEKEKLWKQRELMEELLSASKLKSEDISVVFKKTLLNLQGDDLAQLKEDMLLLIADREEVARGNSGSIRAMGQEKDEGKSSNLIRDEIFVNTIKGGIF